MKSEIEYYEKNGRKYAKFNDLNIARMSFIDYVRDIEIGHGRFKEMFSGMLPAIKDQLIQGIVGLFNLFCLIFLPVLILPILFFRYFIVHREILNNIKSYEKRTTKSN